MEKQDPPVAEQWYPLKLGQTCSDDATSRFYSLRYEFKPASIDTSRRGSLHSSSENKVTVEFFNNQSGKPKVAFEGNVGDYQELDAMLFFDGQAFRLERMHRAVKSLRHIRMPGESSTAAANAAVAAQKEAAAEPESPQDCNGNHVEKISSMQTADKSVKKPAGPVVRSEKIEAEVAPVVIKPDPRAGKKKANKKTPAEPKVPKGKKASPVPPPASAVDRKREREPSPINIDVDEEVEEASPTKKVNVEDEQIEEEEVVEEIEEVSDYEEVDISEDEDADKTGVDQTAATLRAQAAAGLSEAKASSSSSSSGSGSSESGSGSSSSDSGSDEDTASSADDGDDI